VSRTLALKQTPDKSRNFIYIIARDFFVRVISNIILFRKKRQREKKIRMEKTLEELVKTDKRINRHGIIESFSRQDKENN